MLYEITTLQCPPLLEGTIATTAHDWIKQGQGRLLGVWRAEFGDLFQVKFLRGFATSALLEAERDRALSSREPFGVSDASIEISSETYKPFPFLPDVEPAKFGNFYEFRTYFLKPGGLAPTMAAWQDAIGPAREYTSHLVVNMAALDGRPRITHIWGFASLEERLALRTRFYAEGLWPPKGGPQQIARATSMIFKPEPYSPLC